MCSGMGVLSCNLLYAIFDILWAVFSWECAGVGGMCFSRIQSTFLGSFLFLALVNCSCLNCSYDAKYPVDCLHFVIFVTLFD